MDDTDEPQNAVNADEIDNSNGESNEEIVTCLVCGYKDTNEYCSRCGSKLHFLEEKGSPFENLLQIPQEYLLEIINPIFALLKTTMLLSMKPNEFFGAIFRTNKPIKDISFFLSPLWKKLTNKPQYVLDPIKFYIGSLSVAVIFQILGGGNILGELLGNTFPAELMKQLSYLFFGIILLFLPLFIAFVFDSLTIHYLIPSRYKYEFWIYSFGMLWILQIVQILVKIPYLPLSLIVNKILPSVNSLLPHSDGYLTPLAIVISMASVPVMVNLGKIILVFSFIYYIFWVLPNVFNRLYLVPTNDLGITFVKYFLVAIFVLFYLNSTRVYFFYMAFCGLLPLLVLGFYLLKKFITKRDFNSSNTISTQDLSSNGLATKINDNNDASISCPICEKNDVVVSLPEIISNKFHSDPSSVKDQYSIGINKITSRFSHLSSYYEFAKPFYPPIEPDPPSKLGFWKLPIMLYSAYFSLGIGVTAFVSFVLIQMIIIYKQHPELFGPPAKEHWLFIDLLIFTSIICSLIVIITFLILYLQIKRIDQVSKKDEEEYANEKILWSNKMQRWRDLSYCFKDNIVFDYKTKEFRDPDETGQLLISL